MKSIDRDEGFLCVVEGHDGVGKSTQVKLLDGYLSSIGRRVTTLASPGGTVIADSLRELTLYGNIKDRPSKEVRLLLMLAAMKDSWDKVINPALNRGEVVIIDRWLWSNYLYQVVGEGISPEFWTILIKGIFGNEFKRAIPKLTIILTLDEDVRLRRKLEELNQLKEDEVPETERFGSDFEDRVEDGISNLSGLLLVSDVIRVINQTGQSTKEDTSSKIISLVNIIIDKANCNYRG